MAHLWSNCIMQLFPPAKGHFAETKCIGCFLWLRLSSKLKLATRVLKLGNQARLSRSEFTKMIT